MKTRLLVSVLFATACGSVAPASTVDDLPADARAKAPEALWRALAAGEPRSFIVALSADDASDTATATTRRRGKKARMRAAIANAATPDGSIEQDWDELPLVQVHASSLDAALAFVDLDEAASVHEISQYQLTDAESFPLIHQPAAAAAGWRGAGTSVAVLDTGVDYTRADFGGCTAPGVPSTCRVAVARDFAPDDHALDANGHGSNVAGIVAGVAPGTQILALDVFNGDGASSTDILSAINWVIANQQTYHIAAMNLSLGGGSSATACTGDALGVAFGTARAAGIAPVVASGNDGLSNAISWPACAPAAISVGAVYDANVGGLAYSNCRDVTTAADQITCFSNSASILTVLAPGALITAAGSTMAGTSQATPHVAGALAVLRAAFPAESVDQQVARLTSTGVPIRDARNQITKPRIDLYAALATPTRDTTPPSGSVAINGGAATTRAAAVTLSITAGTSVTQMCVSNTATCTAFVAFAASKPWTLTSADGAKTVTVVLRDKAGNAATATAAIRLDATAPKNGGVTATSGDRQLALAWSGFSDETTGVASYRVVVAAGTAAPACSATAAYAGTSTSATLTGLANATTYTARVCALDAAGNLSTGATVSAIPHPPASPPIGTVVINAGATYSKTTQLTLALAATGDAKVTQMCVTEATACSVFGPFAAATSYTVGAGDGPHTVRVWFRDAWGGTSAPASAKIVIDTLAPTGGALAAVASSASNALSWTTGLDATSGVAGYKLVGAPGTLPPASCTSGTPLYSGAATAYVHALSSRLTWSYRLCALDVAGNVSAGSTRTVTK